MTSGYMIYDTRPIVALHIRSDGRIIINRYTVVDQPEWLKNCDKIVAYFEINGEGSHIWFRIERDGVVIARVNSTDVVLVEYVANSHMAPTCTQFVVRYRRSQQLPAIEETVVPVASGGAQEAARIMRIQYPDMVLEEVYQAKPDDLKDLNEPA